MTQAHAAIQGRSASFRPAAMAALAAWSVVQADTVSGRVVDRSNHAWVQGAKVVVMAVGKSEKEAVATTNAYGRYTVVLSTPGTYTLVVSGDGYAELAVPDVVDIKGDGGDVYRDVALTRTGAFKEMGNVTPGAMSWETGAGRSALIPALEILTFQFSLNQVDRQLYPDLMENGKKVYSSTWRSTFDHITKGPWVVDRDAFAMNQFMHPYTGSVYFGFARSAGQSFWSSAGYTVASSFVWEVGGETTSPSYNDMIATGIGGSLLGETLFRMSNLLLEGNGRNPGFLRKAGAALLSPSSAINRWAFGARFKPLFPSDDPSLRWRLQLGGSLHSDLNENGVTSTTQRNQATLDYALDYGLPGKHGYTYDRPFDYFQFEFRSLGKASNPVDSIMIRGLLYGTDYALGDSYKAIWGLYGGYDYIAPYIFRVASTSVSVGTTFQWQVGRKVSIQGSVLGGVGYAAAGNVAQVGERDYHFGVAPQGLTALRFIFADAVMLDMTGRRYYITGTGGGDPGGREAIDRLNVGLTFRIYGRHALGIQYLASTRNAHYPDRPDTRQRVGTLALAYNLLGNAGFGATR